MDNPLFDELRAVHEMIRRDLAKVTVLAEDCAGGAAPDELRARIDELKSSSMLWQLKLGCLQHCRFVHSHHRLEDTAVFPALRRVDPAISPVIDRLEHEHLLVSQLLAHVEGASLALGEPDSRPRLVTALEELATLLLAHLEFEERNLESTLARMGSWSG